MRAEGDAHAVAVCPPPALFLLVDVVVVGVVAGVET